MKHFALLFSIQATQLFAQVPDLSVELLRRDVTSGAPLISKESLNPAKVAVVVVDPWNFHWCKTSAARVGALIPRMNRCLAAARSLGIQIFWCPTDVADNYVGTPAVEEANAVAPVPVPHLTNLPDCPPAKDGGGCTCGKERCLVNYGWDAMHPGLTIRPGDLMPNDTVTLYSLAARKGIDHLIYMGVHTQVCLLGKSVGVRSMLATGMKCMLARDLTDAHGLYDPEHGVTPDDFTADVVAHFEKHLIPTIDMVATLRGAGKWDDTAIVDPVRLAPWGTVGRPHLFEDAVTVTLTTPLEPGAEIRYTTDGSEPTQQSTLYAAPLKLEETTRLRTAAFQGARQVCLASEGYFARLGPEPPKPDVYLSDLKPVRAVGSGHSPSRDDHRFSPRVNPPQADRSNEKAPIKLRGRTYEKGMGVHAPNQLLYELRPELDRFVARAGVDERILETNNGSNLAIHPSVVFRVFIDGKLAAESPVMRILSEPWRFDVSIPSGSRRISLCATDGGNGNREDLANWVDAGFVVKK